MKTATAVTDKEVEMRKFMLPISSLLVLPFLLASPGPGQIAGAPQAPQATQDTAQSRRGPPMRGRYHRHRGRHHWGPGFGRGAGGMLGAGLRPSLLIGLRDELELSEEQVSRLDAISDAHREAVEGRIERMRALHESAVEARQQNDWDALERIIDEGSAMRAEMAKSFLTVARESQEVLSAEQLEKVKTWQEGHRLFRRGRLDRWRGRRDDDDRPLRGRSGPPPDAPSGS